MKTLILIQKATRNGNAVLMGLIIKVSIKGCLNEQNPSL